MMDSVDIAQSYDTIADRWRVPGFSPGGVAQHERALKFIHAAGHALDVGCGCNGRFIDLLRSRGFQIEGVDFSERMIALARERDPDVTFHHADIRTWEPSRRYDFITGWDSIWHVPLADQEAVLVKLCDALKPGGVLIFTLGGTDQPNEIHDASMGVPMYHATMGIPRTLEIVARRGCVVRHLEYDQHPELHVCAIVQKSPNDDLT